MKLKKIILLLSILAVTNSYPQSAVPFLTLQQSPFLQGAGATGVAIISDDPLGFYYNPAILGVTAKSNHISTLFMTKNTDWLGFQNFSNNSYGFNLGYNFKERLPISLGLGFIHNRFSYGNYGYDESFNNISVGVSLNYPVTIGLGVSIKRFNSALAGISSLGQNSYEASGTAFDFGILALVPVSDLLFTQSRFSIDPNSYLTPKMNFAFGYSITNVGGEISYVDPAQADPLPRTAKLGYSITLGTDLHLNDKTISAFEYTFTAEASDLLAESDSNFNVSYKGLLGDINIGRNLIQLKYNGNIVIHKAHVFNILETVKFAFGNFVGVGYDYNPKTSAIAVSSKGIFKLLNNQAGGSVLKFITDHFEIEYVKSEIFGDTSMETEYNAMSIFFNNFEL